MSNPSRVTCIDVGESFARLRNFAREMFSEGYISQQTHDRFQGDLNLMVRQATKHSTDSLTGADL